MNTALKIQRKNKKEVLYRLRRMSNEEVEIEIFKKKIKLPKPVLENIIYTSFMENSHEIWKNKN